LYLYNTISFETQSSATPRGLMYIYSTFLRSHTRLIVSEDTAAHAHFTVLWWDTPEYTILRAQGSTPRV